MEVLIALSRQSVISDIGVAESSGRIFTVQLHIKILSTRNYCAKTSAGEKMNILGNQIPSGVATLGGRERITKQAKETRVETSKAPPADLH